MKKALFLLQYPARVLVKTLWATWKIEVIHDEDEHAIYQRNEVPIYCTWHQRFFPGIMFLPKRNKMAIMVSQSKDGDFISGVVNKLGWHTARGSSSKGGRAAFRELQRLVDDGYAIAHIVDGPRGPFGVIKPGLLRLAQFTGMPIMPIIGSAEKKWVFNSWDRYMIPKPFSRVIYRLDKEIYVPRKISKEALEDLRRHIEERLFQLYKMTDEIWEQI